MVNFKDILLFTALILLLFYSYFMLEQEHKLLYLFLISFILFSFLSLYVSRKYGAKIMGWGAIIKYKDYTSVFINLTQMGLIFNVFFVLYYENYLQILVLVGFIIMFIGMGVNLLVRRDLGKNWVPLSKTTEGQELITSGIYSRVRHPFYTSILILFLGVAVIAWNLYSLLFFVLFIIALLVRIRKEEEQLIIKFGEEYKGYKEKMPMLFPKLKK